MEQLTPLKISARDKGLAIFLIESLDDDGYLAQRSRRSVRNSRKNSNSKSMKCRRSDAAAELRPAWVGRATAECLACNCAV
jgi:DNA-directed RNA polymerase specialized sigma54-like protein